MCFTLLFKGTPVVSNFSLSRFLNPIKVGIKTSLYNTNYGINGPAIIKPASGINSAPLFNLNPSDNLNFLKPVSKNNSKDNKTDSKTPNIITSH